MGTLNIELNKINAGEIGYTDITDVIGTFSYDYGEFWVDDPEEGIYEGTRI